MFVFLWLFGFKRIYFKYCGSERRDWLFDEIYVDIGLVYLKLCEIVGRVI